MSTLSTCTQLLPLRGELGRDYKSGVGKQAFETEKDLTLRYFGVWEHSTRQFGDKAPLLLHYFLKDNTLELRQLQQNMVHKHAFSAHISSHDDRSPFPPVIKRMKIPKPMRPDEGFYHWKDILVGKPLNLLGKNLLIMEADAATQDFYASQGIDCSMLPLQLDNLRYPHGASLGDPDSPYSKMPAGTVSLMKSASIVRSKSHTHEGQTQDSTPSLLRSKSTKPTDFLNYTGRGTPAMRFKAGFVSAPGFKCSASDRERRFVVSFYLEDNTLAISEPPNKLTRTGGPSFYLRQVTCKPSADNPYNPTEPYSAKDFYIGALVPILLQIRTGYEAEGPKVLQLLEADTWTLDFMESRPQTFPMADFTKVKYQLLDELSQGNRAQEFVQLMELACSKNNSGFLYRKSLYNMLRECGCNVPMHSVITLARRLDNDGAGISMAVLSEEFSLPPYEAPCDATGRPGVAAHPAHGHMVMTFPPRAQTAASSVRPSKYMSANANSTWTATTGTRRAVDANRIGSHIFGPDPWHNPYYNRRELGTHLIEQAMTQKQPDLPKWA